FIHMTDVSDATLKIAQSGQPGEAYHISGYELVSIRALVEMILERLGKSFDDCVEIGPERPGKDTAYTLDSFKLRSELGWRDTISLHRASTMSSPGPYAFATPFQNCRRSTNT